jgi:hypothetical protein
MDAFTQKFNGRGSVGKSVQDLWHACPVPLENLDDVLHRNPALDGQNPFQCSRDWFGSTQSKISWRCRFQATVAVLKMNQLTALLDRATGVLTSTLQTYFAPEVLSALQAIFDEVWQEINARPGRAVTAKETAERRTDLAQMIILAHRSGIPPERIRDAVLGRIVSGAPVAAS